MTFDEKNDRMNVTMCKTNGKERKSHEESQKFFQGNWGMYWQRQVPLLVWEIYGDFHIWQQSTEEECSFSFMLYLR